MKRHQNEAFSLAEVCLALGVAAFCLLAVFGLLPVGLTSNQTAIQQTTATNIAAAIAADLRATPKPPAASSPSPRYGLAIPQVGGVTSMQSLFFREGTDSIGPPSTVVNASMAPRFRATIYLTPPTSGKLATAGRIQITWPALPDLDSAVAPSKFSGSFDAVAALDRN